jgi:nicotinamidase-related amidase
MPKQTRTALVLIDFINLFNFPEAPQLAPRAVRAAKATAALKARARAERVPCIYANDNFGDWTSEFEALAEECLKKGGAAAEIARILKREPGDLSVLKPRHSAFYGTPLEFLLKDFGISQLVLTGLTADNCVFATAQDAYVRQYHLWIPPDCIAASDAAFERTALSQMARTLKARRVAARGARTLAWKP